MTKAKKSDQMEISWKAEGAFPVRFAADAFGEGDTTLVDLLKEATGAVQRVPGYGKKM